jgi:methylenetetrahydrofolate reductase (NADPH)
LAKPQFELIPIKGAEDQARHLPPGAIVTVTSSPTRGLEPTLGLCEWLAEAGFAVVPHLSARLVAGRQHLGEVAGRLEAAGIGEIFAIGGDPPRPAGPFDSALSLLRTLAEDGHRFDRVGIAGYPEPHPFIDDTALLRALLDKQPLADYLVTQICYSPQTVVAWIDRVRRAGFRLPVHVGMPGALSRAKLLEISIRVGVGDSVRYLRKNAGIVARLIGRIGYRPDAFVTELASLLDGPGRDVAGLHLNTFNQVQATVRWRGSLIAGLGEAGPRESMA